MDISQHLMNLPVAGESLTAPVGAYPYENPPLINSASESMEFIMNNYRDRDLDEEVLKMAIAGVPLEYTANIMVKMGFVEGIFTADVAQIITPAVMLHLLADAREAGVENIKIFTDADKPKVKDKDFIDIYDSFRRDK